MLGMVSSISRVCASALGHRDSSEAISSLIARTSALAASASSRRPSFMSAPIALEASLRRACNASTFRSARGASRRARGSRRRPTPRSAGTQRRTHVIGVVADELRVEHRASRSPQANVSDVLQRSITEQPEVAG
jgi:hypothetical protein